MSMEGLVEVVVFHSARVIDRRPLFGQVSVPEMLKISRIFQIVYGRDAITTVQRYEGKEPDQRPLTAREWIAERRDILQRGAPDEGSDAVTDEEPLVPTGIDADGHVRFKRAARDTTYGPVVGMAFDILDRARCKLGQAGYHRLARDVASMQNGKTLREWNDDGSPRLGKQLEKFETDRDILLGQAILMRALADHMDPDPVGDYLGGTRTCVAELRKRVAFILEKYGPF